MTKYHAELAPSMRIPAMPEPQTRESRAARDFLLAVAEGQALDPTTVTVLCDAFTRVLAGEEVVFRLRERGGQPRSGFTKADIVGCFIERERRRLEPARGALQRAKEAAIGAFIYLERAKDPLSDVDRQWDRGKALAEGLSAADLDRVLAPYAVPLGEALAPAVVGRSPEEVAQVLDIDEAGILRDIDRLERLKQAVKGH